MYFFFAKHSWVSTETAAERRQPTWTIGEECKRNSHPSQRRPIPSRHPAPRPIFKALHPPRWSSTWRGLQICPRRLLVRAFCCCAMALNRADYRRENAHVCFFRPEVGVQRKKRCFYNWPVSPYIHAWLSNSSNSHPGDGLEAARSVRGGAARAGNAICFAAQPSDRE